MKAKDIEQYVVRPALRALGVYDDRMYTEASVQLMMGTIAQESDMGAFSSQIGGGPALGLGQVERNTHTDNMINFAWSRKDLLSCLQSVSLLPITNHFTDEPEFFYSEEFHLQLEYNWIYNVAQARLKFWRAPKELPKMDDLLGMGMYWDTHYNANPRHGTPKDWVDSYKYFVLGER